MITLDRVTKYFMTPLGRHYVLKNVSLSVPLGRNIGVIGRNGAGKSTLLRLMAGVDYPNKGRITRVGRYSWPLALAGRGIQGNMTGRENVIFAARIHGMRGREIDNLVSRVEQFSELDDFYDMEVSTYSSGMRARLSFAIAMLFDFDCYFIDELNAVGDTRFRRLTKEYFAGKRKAATFIQVSHDLEDLHKVCDAGILVDAANATYFENVDDAIAAYREAVGEPGEDDAEANVPVEPRITPVVMAQSRQARRLTALARKRRLIQMRKQSAAAAPVPVPIAPVKPSTPGQRKPQRPAKPARPVAPSQALGTPEEIQPDWLKRRRQAARRLANLQHLSLKARDITAKALAGAAAANNPDAVKQGFKRRHLRPGLSPAQHLALAPRKKPNPQAKPGPTIKSED